MLILAVILLPLLAGAIMPLLRLTTVKSRGIYVEAIVITTSVLVWYQLITGQGQQFILMSIMDGLTLRFRIDGMSSVFAGLVSFLWPLASCYALEYMTHEEHQKVFFSFYTMTYGVTLAVAFSASLFSLYVFYECLTLITLPLVIHKQDAASSRAGRKYLTFSITGAAMAFMALIALIHFGGDTEFVLGGILQNGQAAGHERLMRFMFLLAFIGFGTKAAVFPMYAWLPAASVAPTPVTALLHAVAVVNTGAFAVLRVIYYSFGTTLLAGSAVQYAALLLACFTIVFGSSMAVKEQHFKRRLAYSTVSNLSYMLMGAALMTPAGMVGSLSHMVIHGIMKITLFYCAGAVLVRTDKEYVQDLRGFGKVMPFTCAIYTIGAVAMVGIPPLCGFVSKWNLLTAAASTGHWTGLVAIAALIVSAVLTAIYLLGPSAAMYFRPLNDNCGLTDRDHRDPSWLMKLPLTILILVMVLLGVYSSPLVTFLRQIALGVY